MVALNLDSGGQATVLAVGAQKGHSRPTTGGGHADGAFAPYGDYRPVHVLILSPRAAGAALAAFMMTLPAAAQQASKSEASQTSHMPTPQELARTSPSGSYLAARQAGEQRDATAASAYYRAALKADPKNPELLERAFLSVLTEGDVEEAVKLADRLL